LGWKGSQVQILSVRPFEIDLSPWPKSLRAIDLKGVRQDDPRPKKSEKRTPATVKKVGQKWQTSTQLRHFMTVAEAAERAGVNVKTMTRWAESGKVPAIPTSFGTRTTYQIPRPGFDDVLLTLSLAKVLSKTAFPHKWLGDQDREYTGSLVFSAIKPPKKPTQEAQLEPWRKAMLQGLIGGKPFSQATVDIYVLYGKGFIQKYGELSIANLKAELRDIPAEMFAKRDKVFKALICLAKFLIDEGLLDEQFCKQVESYRPKRHLPPKRKTVKLDELQKMLEACQTVEETFIVTLLSNTGMRASEACDLKWCDVYSNVATMQHWITIQKGKGGKTRRVAMTRVLRSVMRTYLHALPSHQRKPSTPILYKTTGKPMDRYRLRDIIERIGDRAGVDACAHAFRRAFVTINAANGKSLVDIQIMAGHADITTTRSYCQTTEDEVLERAQGWSLVGKEKKRKE
jgi:integrase